MQNIYLMLSIAILFLLVISIFLYYFQKKHKTPPPVPSNKLEIFKTNNDEQKLTLKEKIELSWKFLYEITELVINKFSKDDIKSVNKLGYILLNNGMRYEHSVQLGIKQSLSKTRTIEQENLRTL